MADHAEIMAIPARRSNETTRGPTSTLLEPENRPPPTGLYSAHERRRRARKAMGAEYARLQLQFDKNRRIIYIGSCILCLFAGFMAGMIIASPRNTTVVTVEVPLEPPGGQAPAQAQTTRL